jgi:hypothetical protein
MVGMAFCALTLLYVVGAVRLLQVIRLDNQLDHVEHSSSGRSQSEAHGMA